ncbi:hypothetical protein BZ25_02835 [Petrotoga sp. Shatin.DS.tank11.9.2.9.3]|nr:hypothetical protein BZ25_02835 [Petrotoga sp. Shatin.DS.tank11.9.2.9.3]
MFNNYDYKYYSKLSSQSGFHKDVIEKVHRLINILAFINNNAFLKERLVLSHFGRKLFGI